MVLKNLEIVNLRNYEYVRLDFSNKINIFYGKNAQGKTNLLEAIYFLGITKSHRTSFDVELLMENKDFFRVNGLIENEYNYNLQIDYVKNRKKCFIDGKKTLKMDDFIGKMKVILFCPEDLNIIKGLPQERREYLDVQIEQFSLIGSKYYSVLNEFNNILKKRNNILKNSLSGFTVDRAYLDILTKFLINKIVYIYKSRKKYVERLNDFIEDIYFKLTGYKGLKLNYKTDVIIDDNLEEVTFSGQFKYNDFSKVSKQVSLNNYISSDIDIYNYAVTLFDKLWVDEDKKVRGLAVGVANLSETYIEQLDLFNVNNNKKNNVKVQKTIDEIRKKYGDNSIIYADDIKN